MQESDELSTLTPLEFEIMSVLWEIAPASVREVLEHTRLSARDLAYNTVQTMLNILVRKKRAHRKLQGRAFFYEPAISKRQVAVTAVGDLLDRLFEGNAERLVMSLLETRRLSPEKLAELKVLVEKRSPMNEIEKAIVEFIVSSVWQIGLILLVAVPVSKFLSRTNASLRECFWILVLILVAVIPVISLFVSIGIIEPFVIKMSVIPVPETVTSWLVLVENGSTGQLNTNLRMWVSLGYFLFFVIALASLFLSARSVQTLKRSAWRPADADFIDKLLERCCRKLKVRPADVLISNDISVPITVGFRKPLILLPSKFENLRDDSTITAALGHELAHIRRRDFLRNLLFEMISLPVLFHPAIWYIRRQIHRYRELATDELVTKKIMSSDAYASSLLTAAEMGFADLRMRHHLAFGLHRLEERIKWQIEIPKLSTRYHQILALVLASFVLTGSATAVVLVYSGSEFMPSNQQRETRTAQSKLHKIDDPGIVMPIPLKQTTPQYTTEAIEAGEEGITILRCIFRQNGRVTDCEIKRELGFGLDKVALREIEENWRFQPATLDGEPVDVEAVIEVQFNLGGGSADAVSPEEAEGLTVGTLQFIGQAEAVEVARVLVKTKEESTFSSAEFELDQERLINSGRFGKVEASILKNKSGRILVRYKVQLKK